MRRMKLAFWGALGLLLVLWLLAEPAALTATAFMPLRALMVQLTGILAIGAMSLAMVLAVRPRWPEARLGGLDKMYRLHKWFGIAALVLSVAHWLWAQAPKWAVGLGWLARPQRGAPPAAASTLEETLRSLRGPAEGLGEWAFYAAAILIVAALVPRIPYRLFHGTHRVLAAVFLVLAFHSVVLADVDYWAAPVGVALALLLAAGTVAAALALGRRIGAGRRAEGSIAALHYYPELRVIEGRIGIPAGWPGHRAGQFAFVTSDSSEGAHPYTIASAWNPAAPELTFVVKELGDHTGRLKDALRVGQRVTVEGPYGCFTFEDDRPRQIWIGAGIGITPFIARMKSLAQQRAAGGGGTDGQVVDLFHTTADYSEEAIAKLTADAAAAGIRLHVLHDARDGLLTGDRIRAAVPGWRDASIWFCGPAGFGEALGRDFARNGLRVATRFHQELFAMR